MLDSTAVLVLLIVACLATTNVDRNKTTVGVCYTRNQVRFDLEAENYGLEVEQWTRLFASASSLRAATNVSSCLFTEAPPHVVDRAMELCGGGGGVALFDSVVSDAAPVARLVSQKGLDELWASITARLETTTERTKQGVGVRDRFESRVKRILNLGRSPFDATLFLDDDTLVCPGDLNLHRLSSHQTTVRVVEHALSKSTPDIARLVEKSAHCEPARRCQFYLDPVALQGGAILVTASSGAAFADDWLAAYLHHWAEQDLEVGTPGTDQSSLDDVSRVRCDGMNQTSHRDRARREWSLAALPATFNVRFIAPGLEGVVQGPIHVLHSHGWHAWLRQAPDTWLDDLGLLCEVLNANATEPDGTLALRSIALAPQVSRHDIPAQLRPQSDLRIRPAGGKNALPHCEERPA